MKHLLRPYRKSQNHISLFAVLAVAQPPCFWRRSQLMPRRRRLAPSLMTPALCSPTPARPATWVWMLADVDADKAQALKLKEVRGAVITLIDHDAPAGQIGLKVNDVVLGINGQNVEGAEALRRMLREIPPGRKVSLEISRDGNIQTIAVQLVDRKAMDHDIWGKIGIDADGIVAASAAGHGHSSRRRQRARLQRLPHVALYRHAERGRDG